MTRTGVCITWAEVIHEGRKSPHQAKENSSRHLKAMAAIWDNFKGYAEHKQESLYAKYKDLQSKTLLPVWLKIKFTEESVASRPTILQFFPRYQDLSSRISTIHSVPENNKSPAFTLWLRYSRYLDEKRKKSLNLLCFGREITTTKQRTKIWWLIMYIKKLRASSGWKRVHSHVTRMSSCNTSANYKERAHTFKISSVLTPCDLLSCTLLTSNDMISLAIWCNFKD